MKIIDKMFDESIKRILIIAGGGYGKTTASKRLALHWADNEFLKDCLLFLRIDCKSIKAQAQDQDLYLAFLEQFNQVRNALNEEELKILKKIFKFRNLSY